MPYAFASPGWSSEKRLGASLGFRLLGVNSYQCVHALVKGSDNIMNFIYNGTKETLGSIMNVDVDPIKLANKIMEDLKEKRTVLGWEQNLNVTEANVEIIS